MLMRNSVVKTAHRRWEEKNAADGFFDVVFTFEDVFDMVIEGLFLDIFALYAISLKI